MAWKLPRAIAVLACLAGCIEIGGDTSVRENGSARFTLEIGVPTKALAMAGTLQKDGEVKDPFANCEAERPASSLPPTVTWVKGVRSQRDDMLVCTVTFDIADPIAAAKNWQRPPAGPYESTIGLADPVLHLERLGDSGYRMSVVLQPKRSAAEDAASRAGNAFGLAMAMMMFADRFITISVSAARIENTTGALQESGRKVVWKIPLSILVQPPPSYRQEIRADIYYRLGQHDRRRPAAGAE